MKLNILSLFSLLSLLLAGSSTWAQEPQLIWKCQGQADPDYANVKIYQVGERMYASIFQESGDGGEAEEDLIEIYLQEDYNDSRVLFVQADSEPNLPGLVKNPSKKTKRAQISIPVTPQQPAFIIASQGPTGDDLDLEYGIMLCEKKSQK